MFAWLRKRRRRRELSPLITLLPGALTKSYGSAEFYTPAQVRREGERLKLNSMLIPFALSAYCKPDESFVSDAERRAHRIELVELFELPRNDFTIEDVRRTRARSNRTPTKWWHNDWSI